MEKHFINLTNGIEAIPFLDDYSFIRIQSTMCENKDWEGIINTIDSNFLMCLALGYDVVIYDYTSKKNKEMPRALYQGLEFIKYILYKRWFGKEYTPMVRNHNCLNYFEGIKLSRSAKRRIDYFKKFLMTDRLKIRVSTGYTKYDGKPLYYHQILKMQGVKNYAIH